MPRREQFGDARQTASHERIQMKRCKCCRRSPWDVSFPTLKSRLCWACKTLRIHHRNLTGRLRSNPRYWHLPVAGVPDVDDFCRALWEAMVAYRREWADEPSSIDRLDGDKTYTLANIQIIPKRLNSGKTRAKALTHEQAEEVRRRRKRGELVSRLATEYGTSLRCISDVANERFYVAVQPRKAPPPQMVFKSRSQPLPFKFKRHDA
jgi:hypothetical protein